jgi:hypothetical protein
MSEEDEICCNACGFEASFVPEGMLTCERCGEVHYCSIECLKWDWDSGGHAKSCVDRRPPEESSSSEGDGGNRPISTTGGTTSATLPAVADLGTSFDSAEQSILSMDVAKVFGLAPGSFDSGGGQPVDAPSKGQQRAASDDALPAKGNVQGTKNFWEAKLQKKDPAPAVQAPSSPAKKKANGGTPNLAAFFESQSPKASGEKRPAALSPTKKKQLAATPPKLAPDGDFVDENDDSMGDDDFNYAMAQYNNTQNDPMDDSFDFMDTSVQTSGLKSIVEESDSWSADEPDLEGSWRSRTPFESASDDDDVMVSRKGETSAATRAKLNKAGPATPPASSMLLGDSEHTEEDENIWETRQNPVTSLLNPPAVPPVPQQSNYIETDDFYEEESMEEASLSVEEESIDESLQAEEGSLQDYVEEELYEEEEYDDGHEEPTDELEESQDDTIDHSDRTPDDIAQAREQPHSVTASTTNSLRLPKSGGDRHSKTSYMPNYGLPRNSSHSEPAGGTDKGDNSDGSDRKRRSISHLSVDSSSRGAASLLDFRQLYSSDSQSSKHEEPSSRLKDFKAVYNGQEDSVSSTGELAPDLFAARTTPAAKPAYPESDKPTEPSKNEALKISLNKALRDFEKLYGPDAARAAVARLTEAVNNDNGGATQAATGTNTASGHTGASASTRDDVCTEADSLTNGRPVSPSSWAMPGGVSVSSGESDRMSVPMPAGFSGKQVRSQSMPLVGVSDSHASLKRESSFSSWAMTGESVDVAHPTTGTSLLGSDSEPKGMNPSITPVVTQATRVQGNERDFTSGAVGSQGPAYERNTLPLGDDQSKKPSLASSSEQWLADLASTHSQSDKEGLALRDEGSSSKSYLQDDASKKSMSESNHGALLVDPFGEYTASRLQPKASSTESPRYMQYRNSLVKQHLGKDTARRLDFDARSTEAPVDNESRVESSIDNNAAPMAAPLEATTAAASADSMGRSSGSSRFQQYRSSLAKRVHPKPLDAKVDTTKKSKTGEALEPAATIASDASGGPRYQAYRSHLATHVPIVGRENSLNRDVVTPEKRIEPKLDGPSDYVQTTPTSSPLYQQYRSTLAKSVGIGGVAGATAAGAVSADREESVPKVDPALSTPPGVVSSKMDGAAPRYAKYRTSLKDRLSTTEGVADQSPEKSDVERRNDTAVVPVAAAATGTIAVAAAAGATTVAPRDPLEEKLSNFLSKNEAEDAELEDRLSSFLAKNEKGKKLDASYSEPVEVPTSPVAQSRDGPPRDLALAQSRKIAAAIASSQLYLDEHSGQVQEPKESRMDEPLQESRAGPKAAPVVLARNGNEPVDVKCRLPSFSGRELSDESVEEGKKHGRKLYYRNQCYTYGLLICLLVAMPLGIGLGIGLTREEDDQSLPRVLDPAPTSAPSPGLRATPRPTHTLSIDDTSAPSVVPTSPPSSVPTTLSPTTETALPTPLTWPPTGIPTSLPSLSPTTTAPTSIEQVLFNLLSSASSDNGLSIEVSGSPQNSAFVWLLGSDTLPSFSDERLVQRYALATFFYSTDGPNWSEATDWLSDGDECLWFSTGSGNSMCDQDDVVATLELGFNGLMGSIPPEIGLLTGLTRIDMSGGVGPGITGRLPEELSALTSLEVFSARDNALFGPLFSNMGAWGNLRILNLSNNDITGPLPSNIGNLASLTFMDISSNAFSGPVPESIGLLTSLVTLSMGNNDFTTLPASIGNMERLSSFDAPFNRFAGPLFDNWAGLVNLRGVDLSSNSLTGQLPTSIGSLSRLLQLNLSDNLFSSVIPSSYGFLTNIFILRLNSNLLTGNVPVSFSNLQFVTEVRVDDNNLTGTVPGEVCDSFEVNAPKFFLDCAAPELSCPPGLCCTYCCTDGQGCVCEFAGTPAQFLC